MGLIPYAVPSDLWTLALPPDSLFGEQGIEPGTWTDPVRSGGTGLGSVVVWEGSHPRSEFPVRVLVVAGGELNETGYLNPGAEPTFRISIDGGTTYSRILRPLPSGRIDHVRGGFGVVMKNGTSGSPITVGSGNAALVVTPKRAGGSIQIAVGSTLTHSFKEGALLLTVANTTTATAAAAYVMGLPLVTAYMGVVAGGDGSGIVQAAARTALPFASFVTGDVWSFATSASPDIVSALQVASDLADGYLAGSYRLPLLEWGADLKLRVCELARWHLLVRRGLDSKQDFQIYNPEKEDGPGTMAWLRGVQGGNVRPICKETPPPVLFPLLVNPVDPLSEEAGSFPV